MQLFREFALFCRARAVYDAGKYEQLGVAYLKSCLLMEVLLHMRSVHLLNSQAQKRMINCCIYGRGQLSWTVVKGYLGK